MKRHSDQYRAGGVAALLLLAAGLALTPVPVAAQSAGMDRADFDSARDSFFSSADGNGDFTLSGGELMNALGATDAQIFDCDDADGDGLCSYSEYLDSGDQLFHQLDEDGDGALSSQELQ